MFDSVSVSRLTLFPSSRVGSSEVLVVAFDLSGAVLHCGAEGVLKLDALGLKARGLHIGDVVGDDPLA